MEGSTVGLEFVGCFGEVAGSVSVLAGHVRGGVELAMVLGLVLGLVSGLLF